MSGGDFYDQEGGCCLVPRCFPSPSWELLCTLSTWVTVTSPTKKEPLGWSSKEWGQTVVPSHYKLQFQTVPKQRPRKKPWAWGSGTYGEFQCQMLRDKNSWLVQSQISWQNKISLPATDSPGSRLNTNQWKANLQNAHCVLKGVTVTENVRKPGRQSSSC